MDQSELTLSVVVISWNQVDCLKRLIPQLLDQDLDSKGYEVIVVDDGSTDGSREWVETLDPSRVRLVCGESNRGRASSRNEGIHAAQGDVIVMIDGDHGVQRNFLSVHVARHARERCVIVGRSDFAEYPKYRALNRYLDESGADKLPYGRPLPGRYFLTRNCSVPRDLLFQVGLFDEEFLGWGGEDLDLGVRLEHSGVPIFGEPAALALHYHHRSLDDLLKTMFAYGRDGIPHLIAKHPFLFEELNLDRVLLSPAGKSRFNRLYRAAIRYLMCGPVYHALRSAANALLRFQAPRILFDYLHLRQYSRGYMTYLRTHGRYKANGNTH
jgi:glycosyltransferase involved in cell wall biosynthesis